ncbi:M28 family peptidase [Candidatus Bathyarchaeota archaeon]|nr:M28 family peptidase [Candidatus Bathyarchaeota archaeon]
MVITDFEREVLDEVSKERLWRHVEWFAEVGEKLSGTPANERAVDYIMEALRGFGVPAEAPRFQAWLGFPELHDAEVEVLEPERRALSCVALAQCASAEVEGQLIDVEGGGLGDYEGLDARGKVALASFTKPPARPWKNYVAGVLKGARGLIIFSHAGPMRALNRGTVKSVWGNPIPENLDDVGRIPAVSVSHEDGVYLKGLLRKGPVRVRMKAEGLRGFYETRQPMARVAGGSTEFVLLGSHMDAWGAAATCNALGCASTLEAARLMAKHGPRLRRGLELLWFQGHETGIMTGSTWYVDDRWGDLNANCVAYLNNDTTNMIRSTVYTADGDPVMREVLVSTVRELAEEEGAPFREPAGSYFPRKYGDQSFYGVGVPSGRVQMTFTPEGREEVGPGGGWFYHSEHDSLDKCDPETMYMAEKAQTLVLLRLCTLPVLPYRFEALADWALEALNSIEGEAGSALDLKVLLDKATRFKEKAAVFDESTGALAAECGDGVDGLEDQIDMANSCMKRISRVLNPVLYTLRGRYDQDYYGAEYVKPIPVLQESALIATLDADSQGYKALTTKLVRARNMVSDALEGATWIADHGVESIGRG